MKRFACNGMLIGIGRMVEESEPVGALVGVAPQHIRLSANCRFHLRIACASLVILIISIVGCKFTSIHVDISGYAIALLLIFAMLAPLPLYWHEQTGQLCGTPSS